MSCLLIGSSRLSPRSSSRRSGRFCVSRPVLRHDGREGGRLRRCYPFSVPISCRLPCPRACLPRAFLAIHLIRMAAGGWRSGVSAGRSACLPVSLYPCRCPSSRRFVFPFHGLFDWLCSVPCPDAVGMSSGGHTMPCVLSSSRVACCVSWLKRRGRGWLPRFRPSFRLPAICVSPRHAAPSSPMCLLGGGRWASRSCVPLASLIRNIAPSPVS